jgi:hypothetical protein
MRQPKLPTPSQRPTVYSFGSNDLSSDDVSQERQKYDLFVFPSYGVENYFDFWRTDIYYGRLSPAAIPMVIQSNFLKQLRYTSGDTLFALNFVADAWRDFMERIRDLAEEGILYDDGPYADMTAEKAWSSPVLDYHNYMINKVYPALKDNFLSISSVDKSITNFDTFIGAFSDFIFTAGIPIGGPLTLSGFMESLYTSPLNTGLVISTSTDNHGDDLNKIDKYMNDANFSVVVAEASRYGFVIDKNAPWRFCADLASAPMLEYMRGLIPEAGFGGGPMNDYLDCDEPQLGDQHAAFEAISYSTIPGLLDVVRHAGGYPAYQHIGFDPDPMQRLQNIFDTAYNPTSMDDMLILKVYLKDFYNAHVGSSPNVIDYDTARRECEDYRNTLSQRVPVSAGLFAPDSMYGAKWDIKSLYLLRLAERRITKTVVERKKDIQNILNLYYFSKGNNIQRYHQALKFLLEEYVGTENLLGFRNFILPGERPALTGDEGRQNDSVSATRQQSGMRRNLY